MPNRQELCICANASWTEASGEALLRTTILKVGRACGMRSSSMHRGRTVPRVQFELPKARSGSLLMRMVSASELSSLSNRWALPTDVMESNKYGNGIYAFEMHTVNASFGW